MLLETISVRNIEARYLLGDNGVEERIILK
jgi:hypothetical protein